MLFAFALAFACAVSAPQLAIADEAGALDVNQGGDATPAQDAGGQNPCGDAASEAVSDDTANVTPGEGDQMAQPGGEQAVIPSGDGQTDDGDFGADASGSGAEAAHEGDGVVAGEPDETPVTPVGDPVSSESDSADGNGEPSLIAASGEAASPSVTLPEDDAAMEPQSQVPVQPEKATAKAATSAVAKQAAASKTPGQTKASQLEEAPIAHVSYRTHVQNVGWQNYVKDGRMAGTSGRALRLEGMNIYLTDAKGNKVSGAMGGIQYQVHVQNIGWQAVKANGAMAGTSGRSYRLEAIRIKLTGELSRYYDVLYRTHVQNVGWQDWVRNGAMAGTSGKGYRLEGIEIKLQEKAKPAAKPTDGLVGVRYRAHVENVGWQAMTQNGATAGTSGRSLRVEALTMELDRGTYSGNIEYRAHVQNVGWQAWKKGGSTAGTTGRSLRVEAFQVRLTGKVADAYDVLYRAHVENVGWQPWAVDGGTAGTNGKSLRVEALQVKLVKKGSGAVISEGTYFLSSALDPNTVADVPSSSTAAGKQLQVAAYNDDFDQRYYITKDDTGLYSLQSVTSALYLGDSKGKLTQQKLSASSNAQKWKAIWNGGCAFVNAKTGKVLSISGGKAVRGAKLVTQADSSKPQQRWTLTSTSLIPEGVYVIANTSAKEVLDVAGAKRTNGVNVGSHEANGGNNQKFTITHLGGEVYSIRNVATKRAVEVANASTKPGGNVQMYTWHSGGGQKWKAQLVGPATFQFLNQNSGLALSRASSAENANIIQAKPVSTKANQQFKLISTSRVREVVQIGVPAILQNPELPTGCESVALTEALRYYGFRIGKTTIADNYMPWSGTDFVYSFMGNPHTNYGAMICAPGITNTANKYLRAQGSSLRATDRTGTSFNSLLEYTDRGVPVVVWSTMYFGNRGVAEATSHGFTMYSGTHAVTITGYDPFKSKIQVADPLSGLVWRDWSRFKSLYNQMGRQAVTIE